MTRTRIGLILLVVPVLLLMGLYFVELSQVRQCQLVDQGHWDYLAAQCRDNPQPFVPWIIRHPWRVNGGLLISVVGLGLCMYGLYRRR